MSQSLSVVSTSFQETKLKKRPWRLMTWHFKIHVDVITKCGLEWPQWLTETLRVQLAELQHEPNAARRRCWKRWRTRDENTPHRPPTWREELNSSSPLLSFAATPLAICSHHGAGSHSVQSLHLFLHTKRSFLLEGCVVAAVAGSSVLCCFFFFLFRVSCRFSIGRSSEQHATGEWQQFRWVTKSP